MQTVADSVTTASSIAASAITPETIIARLATRQPGTIRVFQRHGIDFCCQGGRPLAAACEEKGIGFEALRDELAAAAGPAGPSRDWDEAPLGELIDHVLDRYHARLHEDLPRLDAMAAKVLSVHGEKHPETLPALAATLCDLREELESHMVKEERVLFPAVRALEAAAGGGQAPGATLGLSGPIAMMEHEHDVAAAALAELRRLTAGYQPPAGACTTFRGLYHGLAELESDTHRHIHLENNVLFPRAARLEDAAGAFAHSA